MSTTTPDLGRVWRLLTRLDALVDAHPELKGEGSWTPEDVADLETGEEDSMEETHVRIPRALIDRAAAQWDALVEEAGPMVQAAMPRRSGAAAVRIALELKLRELEGKE